MSISRTATGGYLTDDGGTGTTGTILNNSERQSMLDLIDARWTEQQISLTGSQNNLSITSSGLEADVVQITSASDITITGIAKPASPARPGKKLKIISIGAGNVFLKHNSASSTAGNRLFHQVTVGDTALAGGIAAWAEYTYDAVNSYWRMTGWDQGKSIAYTPTLAVNSGSLTSASATGRYHLREGRKVHFQQVITITTNGTAAGYMTATLPFAAAAVAAVVPVTEVAVTGYTGSSYIAPSDTKGLIKKYDGAYFGANSYVIVVSGEYETT